MESVIEIGEGMKGIDEIRRDDAIKYWLSGARLKDPTIPGYLVGIRYFCQYTGKTPKELIEEAEKEMEQGIPMRRRKIKKYLVEFREWLINKKNKRNGKKIAPKTIHRYMASIRSFYTFHEIDLPKGIKNRQAETLEENNRRLTKEMVDKALKYCSIRDRSIILTMLSSGISGADVRNLKIRDFKSGYDEKTGITTLKLRRRKTNIDFITFLTPEASRTILDYLEWRNREPNLDKYSAKIHKENMKNAYEKRKVRDKDGYLFILNFIPDEYLDAYDEEKRKMTHNALLSTFRYTAKKSGLGMDKNKGQWQVFRGHNLRKLFYTQLRNEGADTFIIEFWMGHKIPEEQASYFHAIPEKLRKIYMKHMHLLEITPTEVKTLESKEYTELRKKFGEIREENQQMRKDLDALMHLVTNWIKNAPRDLSPDDIL